MFQNLQEKLAEAFKKFRNKGTLTEKDVREGMRAVKLALLEADVNFKVVREFINKVTERAVGAEVLESLMPAQQVVKIVNEELTALMGGTQSKLQISSKPPTIVMMVGLQGAGKTTHAGKLAAMMKKQGKNPLLVACDVYRPAAIRQLQIVGEKAGVTVYAEDDKTAPLKIAKNGLSYARKNGYDMVFIDANKRRYEAYYRLVLPALPGGGYILADNTLWGGKVLDDDAHDPQTQGIRTFNDLIASDTAVEKVIIPVRDGLTLIRKR